jgi:hypothetical protein
MIRSSAVETHLQVIAPLLLVDAQKSWTTEEDADADFIDFLQLKPHSMRKGKPLLPWESYRDWLGLMVHYFDAAKLLTTHFDSMKSEVLPTLSITIISPPCPDDKMLSWTNVLEKECFFPNVRGESTGPEFITFLNECIAIRVDGTSESLPNALTSAKRLINSDLLVQDSSTMINEIASEVENSIGDRHYEIYVGEIKALNNSQPQDRLAEAQKIVDQLSTLTFRNTFYNQLRKDPLRKGVDFSGKFHCEAYMASLITLLSDDSGLHYSEFEDGLSSLSSKEINDISALLHEIKASQVFIRRLNLSDFTRIAGKPWECLNDAARCALSYSNC